MTRARDTADLLVLAPTAQDTEPETTHPLIINGDMRITQRMDSDSTRNGLNIDISGYFTHDRWALDMNNSGACDTTVDTDVPSGAGFKTSLKVKCRTADASLAASDRLGWRQIIEDQKYENKDFIVWKETWKKRLLYKNNTPDKFNKLMRSVNPLIIPRNHLVENSLKETEQNNLKPINRLLEILEKPYTRQENITNFQRSLSSNEKYQTFCGT